MELLINIIINGRLSINNGCPTIKHKPLAQALAQKGHFTSAKMCLGHWLLFAVAAVASGDGIGLPETGELRKLLETPSACAEACPSINAYMEDREAWTVNSEVSLMNLWCNHQEALACGFQASECSNLTIDGGWYHIDGFPEVCLWSLLSFYRSPSIYSERFANS